MGGAMTINNNLFHWYVDWQGRRQGPEQVTFQDEQLIAQGSDFGVSFWFSAHYFNLPANVMAIITLPNGNFVKVEGGFCEMPSGRYQIQYVTTKELSGETRLITENTIDGAQVSISVFFRYRVADAISTLNTADPLTMLVTSIENDIREYIRANTQQSLWDASRSKGDKSLSRFLKQHPNASSRSRSLIIIDADIRYFKPDEKFLELVRTAQLQGLQNRNDKELLSLNQELEQKIAAQDKLIKKLQAEASAEQQDIMREVELKNIDVENKRRAWQRQYDSFSRVVQAISDSVSSGQVLSNEVMTNLSELADALRAPQSNIYTPASESSKSQPYSGLNTPPSPGVNNEDKVERLTNTLLNLLRPR
jgi:hypothetical protein